MERRINLCQPGHGASCSRCCGSHNYVIPKDDIEKMLLDRDREFPERPMKHQDESLFEKLFGDDMQCPHVGIRSSDPGVLCCLIYGDHDRGKEIESFFNGTCKNFYCQAWSDLTDRQVDFAARLMGDWYYYSLFINHIEAVQNICAQYERPEDVPPEELLDLKDELVERFMEEDGK